MLAITGSGKIQVTSDPLSINHFLSDKQVIDPDTLERPSVGIDQKDLGSIRSNPGTYFATKASCTNQ
jgi:hypothetical protein